MAAPTDAGRNPTNITAAADPWTVNLPGSISAGDLLIVYIGQTSNTGVNIPSGWTAVPDIDGGVIEDVAGGGGDWQTVMYRWADGTEGATIQVDMTGSDNGSALSWRITGAENPLNQAPEGQFFTTGTATANSCDPPSLTPSGGSKDYLWIAIGHLDGESSFTGAPSSFANLTTANSGTTGGAGGNNFVGGATRQFTGTVLNPGAFTHGAGTNGQSAITIAIYPPTAGTFKTLTVVTETDTAQALTFVKPIHKTLTAAAETDTAQALSIRAPIEKTLTPATETDSAQAISVVKPIRVTLVAAAESDVAQTVAFTKPIHITLTAATETGTAQALSVSGPTTVNLVAATETSSAQALNIDKHVTLTAATETDTAQALDVSGPTIINLTPAAETDTAVPLSVIKPIHISITATGETDLATALSYGRLVSITPAAETNSAQALNVDKLVVFTPALEVDTAQAVQVVKTIYKTLTPGLETDVAVALDVLGGALLRTAHFGLPSPSGGGGSGSPSGAMYGAPSPEQVRA